MNKITVEDAMEEVLKIERASIKKRQDIVNAKTAKLGKNKADADVVNKIIAVLEAGGIGNEA